MGLDGFQKSIMGILSWNATIFDRMPQSCKGLFNLQKDSDMSQWTLTLIIPIHTAHSIHVLVPESNSHTSFYILGVDL